MHLHIVGGFLGSGKTTAIIGAAQCLASQNKKVGVITNDQGKHLVDTAILRAQDLPAMEVSGGCFCCHFNDLNDRLKDLIDEHHPDVIFAESVGSCADVVATVVKPLLEMEIGAVKPNSYTVFADVRLLRRYLLGLEMPFSEGINYIFEKQIEEAGLLFINKTDLFSAKDVNTVISLAEARWPEIPAAALSALNTDDIAVWVDALQTDAYPLPVRPLEIDYDRYAAGEGGMAWIDREYHLSANREVMPELIEEIISRWQVKIRENGWVNGHVKVALSISGKTVKFSISQSGEVSSEKFAGILKNESFFYSPQAALLLNMLVEGNLNLIISEMEKAIYEAIEAFGADINVKSAFNRQPGYPKPTYRIGK